MDNIHQKGYSYYPFLREMVISRAYRSFQELISQVIKPMLAGRKCPSILWLVCPPQILECQRLKSQPFFLPIAIDNSSTTPATMRRTGTSGMSGSNNSHRPPSVNSKPTTIQNHSAFSPEDFRAI